MCNSFHRYLGKGTERSRMKVRWTVLTDASLVSIYPIRPANSCLYSTKKPKIMFPLHKHKALDEDSWLIIYGSHAVVRGGSVSPTIIVNLLDKYKMQFIFISQVAYIRLAKGFLPHIYYQMAGPRSSI